MVFPGAYFLQFEADAYFHGLIYIDFFIMKDNSQFNFTCRLEDISHAGRRNRYSSINLNPIRAASVIFPLVSKPIIDSTFNVNTPSLTQFRDRLLIPLKNPTLILRCSFRI